MIIITIKMVIPTDKKKELLQTLIAITEKIRVKNGCLGCDVLKSVENEDRYSFIVKWESNYDVNKHLTSEEFSVLTGAMNLLKKKAEIKFDVVSYTKGIEEIQKARSELNKIKFRI